MISCNTYKMILFLKKMIYNINNEKICIFNYLRNSNVVVVATIANKSIIVFIILELCLLLITLTASAESKKKKTTPVGENVQ